MSLHYSPSTGGFYDTAIHATLPTDAVSISKARHAQLMAGQANGAAIVAAPDTGNPVLKRRANDTATRRALLVKAIKREAATRIKAISPEWQQLNDLRDTSQAGAMRFAQIDAVRAASNAIEALLADTAAADLDAFPITANPLWPTFEDAA